MVLARAQKQTGMVEGISLFGRPWLAGSALVVSCLVLSYASVSIGEDSWQWRTDKIDDGRRLLAFTEFDAGDHFSGLSYYCKPSSGRIEVRGSTDKQQRQVFAGLQRKCEPGDWLRRCGLEIPDGYGCDGGQCHRGCCAPEQYLSPSFRHWGGGSQFRSDRSRQRLLNLDAHVARIAATLVHFFLQTAPQ